MAPEASLYTKKISQIDEIGQEYYFYYKSSSYQHEVKKNLCTINSKEKTNKKI